MSSLDNEYFDKRILVSSVIPSNMNEPIIYSYKKAFQSYTYIVVDINNIKKIIFIEKPSNNVEFGNLRILHMQDYCEKV